MSLSCSCAYDYDGEPGSWFFYQPNDFSKFEKKRRKRCYSCAQLVEIGADCLEFQRGRAAYTEIEERISGEEVAMSSLFMCERCGEIYLNLTDIGYCLDIADAMEDVLIEYQELTGFNVK